MVLLCALHCIGMVCCLEAVGAEGGNAPQTVDWEELKPGLHLAEVTLDRERMIVESADMASPAVASGGTAPVVALLRIDPARYTFCLHMASADEPRSLPELAERNGLVAAINASMYLPDGRTSTGYMRDGGHVNNPRVAGKFGAFFVANPKNQSLPSAVLLDRATDDWKSALSEYELVIQNFRVANAQGKILWNRRGEPHSVAALSQNKAGDIVFIFCREPVHPAALARELMHFPLQLKTVMYLEGGTPAVFLVKTERVDKVWVGKHISGLWGTDGSREAPLPNVLGIKEKEQ